MLINNGYAPEWVLLEKEIRDAREDLRNSLKIVREQMGPLPLTKEEEVHCDFISYEIPLQTP